MTRKQYLNGVEHDISFLETEIKKNKSFYWMGDLIRIQRAQQLLLSLRIEQGRLLKDKNYNPQTN